MPNRPMPVFPEQDSQPFWEGAQRGELRYKRCDDCQSVVFYPRAHCTACGSARLSWHVSGGAGTVYTFSVVRQSRNPAFAELGAYAVAYVDLDEGFRIMSNVVGVQDPVRDVHCGMRVKLRWEDQGEGAVS